MRVEMSEALLVDAAVLVHGPERGGSDVDAQLLVQNLRVEALAVHVGLPGPSRLVLHTQHAVSIVDTRGVGGGYGVVV